MSNMMPLSRHMLSLQTGLHRQFILGTIIPPTPCCHLLPSMVHSPQQCIRPTHLPPWLVGQDEVEPGEVQGPVCLAAVQLVSLSEIRQILMICVDLELLIGAFKEVSPLF